MISLMKVPGWYPAATREELDVGTVVPRTMFDDEYVLYRGRSSSPTMLSAFCPHLGSHLGYGGSVIGDDIRCPFHHWTWSPSGENVDIPYSDRPIKGRRMDVIHVLDRDPFVIAATPGSDVPVPDLAALFLDSYETSGWATRVWDESELDIRLPISNLSDPATLRYLYGLEVTKTTVAPSSDGYFIDVTHQVAGGEVRVAAVGLGLVAVDVSVGGIEPHLMGLRPTSNGQAIVVAAAPEGAEAFEFVDRHVGLMSKMAYRPPLMVGGEDASLSTVAEWIAALAPTDERNLADD